MLLLSYNEFSFSVILQQVEKETFTFREVFFSLKQRGGCQRLLSNSTLIIPLYFLPLYPFMFLFFLQLTALLHSKVSSSKLELLMAKYFLVICQCFQHWYMSAFRSFQFVGLFSSNSSSLPLPVLQISAWFFFFFFTVEGAIFPT